MNTPSSRRTTTALYGVRSANAGSVGGWIIVVAHTSPVPGTATHSTASERHAPHNGRGGCRNVAHAAHRCNRTSPFATDDQNSISAASTGSGRGYGALTDRLRAAPHLTDR